MDAFRDSPGWFHDALLIGGFVLFACHIILFLINFTPCEIHFGLFSIDSSLSLLLLIAVFYGFIISSSIYYFQQQKLLLELSELKRVREERDRVIKQLSAMKGAAAQILVPFPLDQLVDRGLDKEVAAPAYRPGLLHAQPVKQTT
jgi:hypothetical protein